MIAGLLSSDITSWMFLSRFTEHTYNDGLLSKGIYTPLCNSYSLWGKDCLLVPTILDNKIEHQTPIPQINDESA